MSDDQPLRVAIIGAGRMGAGIAQVFASAGVPVAVCDPDATARSTLAERIGEGCVVVGIDAGEVVALVAVYEGLEAAVRGANLVIEAGPENLPLKRAIFAELEAAAEPRATLATNTSAIPIRRIAESLADPSRVVGTHFWNPAYLIPLVEVVQAPSTSAQVVGSTIGILSSVGLRPIHVAADVPGFVGNRLQHALKREAIALVANGVCTAETVDTVVRWGFGRRLALVGPLEQADLGGLDLTLAIHEVLMPDLDVTDTPHPLLVDLVRGGDLGAKTGRGFFSWAPGDAERRRAEINRALAEQAREDRG